MPIKESVSSDSDLEEYGEEEYESEPSVEENLKMRPS